MDNFSKRVFLSKYFRFFGNFLYFIQRSRHKHYLYMEFCAYVPDSEDFTKYDDYDYLEFSLDNSFRGNSFIFYFMYMLLGRHSWYKKCLFFDYDYFNIYMRHEKKILVQNTFDFLYVPMIDDSLKIRSVFLRREKKEKKRVYSVDYLNLHDMWDTYKFMYIKEEPLHEQVKLKPF